MDAQGTKRHGRFAAFGLCAGAARSPGTLGDHPRLPKGVVLRQSGTGLVLRSALGSLEVAGSDREWFCRIAGKLDGETPLSQILANEKPEVSLKALGYLSNLAEAGILSEGPAQFVEPGRPPCLDDQSIVLLSDDALTRQIGGALRQLGARVESNGPRPIRAKGTIALYAHDQADLSDWEKIARRQLALNIPLVAVLPLGDAVLVGVGSKGAAGPCLACLTKAWLGLSPTIALEQQFLARPEHALQPTGPNPSDADRLAGFVALCLTWPTTAPHATIFDPETGEWAGTRLYPHPLCPVCSNDKAPVPANVFERGALAREAPPMRLAQLAHRIAPLTGLPSGIAAVLPLPKRLQHPAPGIPRIALARYCVPDPAIIDQSQANFCHGSAKTVLEAEALAVVEAVERFAGLARPAGSILSTYEDITQDALLPTDLPLFSPRQYAQPGFRFRPFDQQTAYRWTQGWNLTREAPVWLPLSAVSYGYDDTLLAESSSGVAAHSQRSAAIESACLELIERDAFMIHWLNRLVPRRITAGSIKAKDTHVMLAQVSANGAQPHLLDITTDLDVPVCLALAVHRDGQRPALTVGAGAAFDMQEAAGRAVRELYAASLSPGVNWAPGPLMAPEEVLSLEDNSRAYAHPDWLQHAEFLWSSEDDAPEQTAAGTGANSLNALIGLLADKGLEAIAVDLTPQALAASGLCVVRAIVPGLQPLALGAGPRLGGRRVFDAPLRMGRRAAPLSEDALNPLPHCFP